MCGPCVDLFVSGYVWHMEAALTSAFGGNVLVRLPGGVGGVENSPNPRVPGGYFDLRPGARSGDANGKENKILGRLSIGFSLSGAASLAWGCQVSGE